MLLGIIAIATPALAIGKHNKFDPNTLPKKGTQYVLTIEGIAKPIKQERGPFKAHPEDPAFDVKETPVEGRVLITVDESQSLNPTVVRFVVESGYIETDNKVYAIDNGVAIYHNRFGLAITSGIDGTDLIMNAKGALSGGIPDAENVSNVNRLKSNLTIGGEKLIFKGSISMTEFV